jgi:hypothetical protein
MVLYIGVFLVVLVVLVGLVGWTGCKRRLPHVVVSVLCVLYVVH